MRETLDISVRVLKRLAVPHHTVRSWSMVAKRERLSDDQVTRALARASELVGGDLTEVRDNRLVPTALGHEFYKVVEPVLHLSQGETIEVLTIAVTPAIDPALVAGAMIEFSQEWGKLVGFRLTVLPDGIRETVESGQAALGIVGVGGAEEPDEYLKPTLPVVALIPEGHRLAGAGGPLDADHFSPTDRVFASPALLGSLDDLLSRVPVLNRVAVECLATLRELVESGAGIGLEYAHPIPRVDDAVSRIPVVGVESLTLGLVLPRKLERLSEPARYFLDVLRRGPELFLPSIPPAVAIELDLPPVPESIAH